MLTCNETKKENYDDFENFVKFAGEVVFLIGEKITH